MASEANWYPDPEGPGLRWWDGAAWSEHRKEAPAPPNVEAAARIDSGLPTDTGVAAPGTSPSGPADAAPGPPPVTAWPPPADENNFEARAAANSDRSTATPAVSGTDSTPQGIYRRMASDPGMWTRRVPEPAPVSAPPTRGAKVAMVVVLIFIVGIIASIFHIGGSGGPSKGSTPTASESYEEKYEAAHDAVCEHAPWKYEPECQ